MSVGTSSKRLEATTKRTWRLPPEYARSPVPHAFTHPPAGRVHDRERGRARDRLGDARLERRRPGDERSIRAARDVRRAFRRVAGASPRARVRGDRPLGRPSEPGLGDRRARPAGAGGAPPTRDRGRDVRDLGRPGEHPARVRARARGRHQRDRRRLLRRSRRARARAPRARRHARGREPSGADAGGSAGEDRCRGRHDGRDGRHRLVGNAGLRRRQGDRGARRARRCTCT